MRSPQLGQIAAGGLITVGIALAPSPASAADRVYYYLDEAGVYHFSNVPADDRYKPLTPATGPELLPGVPPAPRPTAPATAAAPAGAAPPAEQLTPDDLELEPEPEDR